MIGGFEVKGPQNSSYRHVDCIAELEEQLADADAFIVGFLKDSVKPAENWVAGSVPRMAYERHEARKRA